MRKVALLIGVSKYGSGLKPLPAAERDIKAVQEVLQDQEIGGFDEVLLFPNPGLLEMRQAISNLYRNRDTEDIILFYFSGHGLTDEFGKFFLTNCQTEKVNGLDKATALEASFIHDQIENCDSKRQVIILDCCHSGAFPVGMTARSDGTIDFQNQLGGKGRVILTSSAAHEYSFERHGEELAVYTRYLVEGIKTGAADLDKDGFISVNELHDYVKEQVRKAAPSMCPERIIFEEGEKILIAKASISIYQRKYRKYVEKFVKRYGFDGEIRPAERRIWDLQYQKLKLSSKEAEAIEVEVLRPYREYQKSVKEYEECLIAELGHEQTLSNRTKSILKDLQEEFHLTNETILSITNRVLQNLDSRTVAAVIESSPNNTPPNSIELPVEAFNFDVIKIGPNGEEMSCFLGRAYCFTEKLNNDLLLEMVYIPGGSFCMGSSKAEIGNSRKEKPQHTVSVKPFFISKYPITIDQWKAISLLPIGLDDEHLNQSYPVTQISWHDAVDFCVLLSQKTRQNYRLPTEAEWEYACRAGTITPFHFGETITSDLANFDGDYSYRLEPKGTNRAKLLQVGTFQYPNTFGLYDMHGNVWEWCIDNWHKNYTGAPNNGEAWIDNQENPKRISRGGSYKRAPSMCRSAFREIAHADYKSNDTGFRIVLSLE